MTRIEEIKEACNALEAKITGLQEALAPFAKFADWVEDSDDGLVTLSLNEGKLEAK